ncbi:MAG: phosphotransferase family protein [Myxococcota bacterium]
MADDPGATPTLDDHASGLRDWIAGSAGGKVLRAERHPGGSHRISWQVDVEGAENSRRELFLTLDAPDAGGDDGNATDAAVLAALGNTSIPVPGLVGRNGPGGALLMERVPGRSDAPSGDDLEPVMADLMRQMACVHRLEPDTLPIPELTRPRTPEGLALDQLEALEASYLATPSAHHPLVDFGLGWLRRNAPGYQGAPALVHGDIGPGNMIYAGGQIRAIIDWEIAHWGDPMEDLAALSVRDMATPIGSFELRIAQYEAASAHPVDPDRLRYYRALVLVRNSLLICLTLAKTAPPEVPPQLRAFALLLRRAATQALGEASKLLPADPVAATPASPPDLPARPLEDDASWIPALAAHTQAACNAEGDLMGPLAKRFLQPVPGP